ncbi:MAG TPA: NapC/NirT family cytochrome c [Phycisphaerae bacterium]|nr:NapC/NirT family cytochrome c [Phycisphaerae bacterium]
MSEPKPKGHPGLPTPSKAGAPATLSASADRRARRRKLLKRIIVVLVIFLFIAAGGMVGAEVYTSRPQFCGTCHVMDKYYRSWSVDIHGYKLGARCVDCHYAPGEQHTIHAKFRGLSQVASYFSGRYGQSRPRAHVKDASCLTAPCHGDRAYLGKSLLIGEVKTEKRIVGGLETEVQRNPTVKFVHMQHLNIEVKVAETELQLEQVLGRVQRLAGPDKGGEILAAAMSVGPSAKRESDMRKLLTSLDMDALTDDALELMRLEHLRTRQRQLTGLNCAACHGYDESGTHHLKPADLQTCFTCHFNNQAFNRDTGECLKCHEPPVRQILVHDQFVSLTFKQPGEEAAATTQPVLMDHRDIVARKIDCVSCHFDVIQGEATVSVRDCTHCHDQEYYWKDFETRTTDTVAEYHRAHVATQTARCLDCHRVIQHQLINPVYVGTSADYLKPVLNDCQHCHPTHHLEQIELLMGIGGAGVARPMPNAMFGSRINCRACHVKSATDMKGDALIKATESTCIACHGADYERLFEQWQNEIGTYLKEAEEALKRVDDRIEALNKAGTAIPDRVADLVKDARQNVEFVKAGNGLHNKNYALELLDIAIRDLDEAVNILLKQ